MSDISRIAEEFAEQKVAVSHTPGIDLELLKELWKANALEVLAFAVPRLVSEHDEDSEALNR